MAPPRRETRLHAFADPAAPAERAPEPQGASPDERAVTVTAIVQGATRALAAAPHLQDVWVRGEISGFSAASSGHWYFSMKDETCGMRCVMWRGANARVKFRPEEGMEVLARGRVSVYAARGEMQFTIDEMRPVGVGALQLAFEQLKRKLAAEGLFDEGRKRALPAHPDVVGVVTSLEAAALQDIIRVATSRNPAVKLLVAHARVQGDGASLEIASALSRLSASGRCDVIIVGRGGGSIEDLWAFNEEPVVRAVVACGVPVVSAVGHETDFTLTDFAADERAPTPSAAAELVVPDAEAIAQYLDDADERMRAALGRLVPELRQRIDELQTRAENGARRAIERARDLVASHAARLDALSPLAVLARGYAVARRARDRHVVRRVDDAKEGDDVEIILQDGALDATVKSRRKEEPTHGENEE